MVTTIAITVLNLIIALVNLQTARINRQSAKRKEPRADGRKGSQKKKR